MPGNGKNNPKRFGRILLVSPGFSKGRHRIAVHPLSGLGYIAESLKNYYNILYTGENGRVAHEMILDCRQFKDAHINESDIGFTVIKDDESLEGKAIRFGLSAIKKSKFG